MRRKKDNEDLSETNTSELHKTLRSYKIMAIVLGVIGLVNLVIAIFLWGDQRSASIQTGIVAAVFFTYGTYIQTAKVAPRIAELASR